MQNTSFYLLLQAGHSAVGIQSKVVIHFNHLSDVRHEADYYHSGPHGTLSSPLVQDLKESSSPPLPLISVHYLRRALGHLFLALMDSTQANGQPLGSSQTDKGAEIHGVPQTWSPRLD